MSAGLLVLLGYVGMALALSFLCSLLEASLLTVGVPELLARQKAGDRGAAVLLEIKQQRVDDGIAAILTLNTIAHTIGAALSGAQAARVFGDRWVGVFSAVLTLLILALTEIVPKTLGTAHASRLAGFTGRTVRLLTRLLAPALVLTRFLTRLLWRGESKPVSRGELEELVSEADRQGSLASGEAKVLANALRFEDVAIEHVMTPRPVVTMRPAESTVAGLLEDPDAASYSRIPLYEGSPDLVVGYVLHREVLAAAARGGDLGRPLADFQRPLLMLPESLTVGAALRAFLEKREHLAVVTDAAGTVTGVLTLEDVIETMLGTEIVDESDRVPDLRAAAQELRARRLQRMRERRGLAAEPQPEAPAP